MQNIVFLGIFDKIANWIMSGVTKVLTWLVSNIIAPVCTFIWNNALKYVVEEITELISVLLYQVYALILSILYALETAVYSFAGVKNVSFGSQQDNILSLIFSQPAVKKAFWYITAIAVVLLFIFTVITVIKTTLDFGYDGKKNMGTIMTSFITSAITFLILPVFCYGLVQLTSVCMNSLYAATSQSDTSSITDNLFILSIRANVSDTAKNGISQSDYSSLIKNMSSTPMFWRNYDSVKPFIHKASNVDYVVGTLGAIILVINLIIMSGTFIQRVIEIVMLYIVSPIFVSTIPLDDGERFGRWRRTFIGRLCMGVSMIVALNVVMMLISIIISGSSGYTIRFTSDVSVKTNTVQAVANDSVDIILKLIFMIGCIISVKNIGSMVTDMIDEESGAAERESVRENTRRLVEAPRNMAKTVGAVKGIAEMGSAAFAQHQKRSTIKGSQERGFRGETANASEQSFYDSVKRQNSINSAKAVFTKRGAKYSALNEQAKKGNAVLSQFRQLKTHEERSAFMQSFKKSGGIGSLQVNGSKFGSSQMTSVSERKALSNLESRIDTAKANRDRFAKGTAGYKKYDNQLKNLAGIKTGFNALNTHKERAAFIGAHKEFGNITSRGASDMITSVRLDKRAQEAKAERDKFEKGSAAWKKADERYQSLLNRRAEFDSLTTKKERDSFMQSNSKTISGSSSLSNINKRIDQTEKARNSFERGSEGWKKYDSQLKELNSLSDQYSSMSSDEERETFAQSNAAAFGNMEAMSSDSKKSLGNIDKKIASVTKARNRFAAGSAGWNKYNAKLNDLNMQRADFTALATNEQRKGFAADKAGFKDSSNKHEDAVLNNIDAKRLTAVTNRNMFDKGSSEWNFYNEKIEEYDNAAAELLSLDSTEDKTAYIAANPIFNKTESTSFANDKQRKALTGNLNRAVQARNRHKQGSAKWQQCNERVNELKRTVAAYDSLETRKDRDDFAQKNSSAFDTSLNNDAGYNKIENAYKSWSALEQYAATPKQREHAHKMAKSYADFSERYAVASPEERGDIINQADSFEAGSATAVGIGFSVKEYAAVDSIKATGNEAAIRDFVNADSHSARAVIMDKAAKGEYTRFEIPTTRETNYSTQLNIMAERYSSMAESTDDGTRKQTCQAMSAYCRQAAEQYSKLSTHSQRESFASHISSEIRVNGGTAPVIKPPQLTERETEFAGSLSEAEQARFSALSSHRERYHYIADYHIVNENMLALNDDEIAFYNCYLDSSDMEYERTARYKAEYAAAPTHEARTQIMNDYADYLSTASETEQPGKWNYTQGTAFTFGAVAAGVINNNAQREAAASVDNTSGGTAPSGGSIPSPAPSSAPSGGSTPSPAPSSAPSGDSTPSPAPSSAPSGGSTPSPAPSSMPSESSIPSPAPSSAPSGGSIPSPAPSNAPSGGSIPSPAPSGDSIPSPAPSSAPSGGSIPSPAPSSAPSESSTPSPAPSSAPSGGSIPSPAPSSAPSGGNTSNSVPVPDNTVSTQQGSAEQRTQRAEAIKTSAMQRTRERSRSFSAVDRIKPVTNKGRFSQRNTNKSGGDDK